MNINTHVCKMDGHQLMLFHYFYYRTLLGLTVETLLKYFASLSLILPFLYTVFSQESDYESEFSSCQTVSARDLEVAAEHFTLDHKVACSNHIKAELCALILFIFSYSTHILDCFDMLHAALTLSQH